MLSSVAIMKPIEFLALTFVFLAGTAGAAGVRLERLEDFNSRQHKIFVNIEVDIKGNCLVDPGDLEETFTGLLGVFKLQTAPAREADLEFAVSVKGIPSSGIAPCGLKVLSMARQIPNIAMLSIPPGSTSTRFRLWTAENILTATQADVRSSLHEQARKDVVAFTRALSQ